MQVRWKKKSSHSILSDPDFVDPRLIVSFSFSFESQKVTVDWPEPRVSLLSCFHSYCIELLSDSYYESSLLKLIPAAGDLL